MEKVEIGIQVKLVGTGIQGVVVLAGVDLVAPIFCVKYESKDGKVLEDWFRASELEVIKNV